MKLNFYCQSVQKLVYHGSPGPSGEAGKTVQYAISLQTHKGDGLSIDSSVLSGSFAFTVSQTERPEFDSGDIVSVTLALGEADPDNAAERGARVEARS